MEILRLDNFIVSGKLYGRDMGTKKKPGEEDIRHSDIEGMAARGLCLAHLQGANSGS